jgi:hypothetical protein
MQHANLFRKIGAKRPLGICSHRSIILKWILNTEGVMLQTEFVRIRIKYSAGILWTRQWNIEFHMKAGNFFTSWAALSFLRTSWPWNWLAEYNKRVNLIQGNLRKWNLCARLLSTIILNLLGLLLDTGRHPNNHKIQSNTLTLAWCYRTLWKLPDFYATWMSITTFRCVLNNSDQVHTSVFCFLERRRCYPLVATPVGHRISVRIRMSFYLNGLKHGGLLNKV